MNGICIYLISPQSYLGSNKGFFFLFNFFAFTNLVLGKEPI